MIILAKFYRERVEDENNCTNKDNGDNNKKK